jgi:peptide/nickel transport system ATP-binding protein
MLEAEDVDVVFATHRRSLRAVAGASLKVGAGRAVALVGESGSGKTTLGRVFGGLQPVTRGVVTLDGRELPRSGSAELRAWRTRVGFMFQDPIGSLSPHQAARDAVAEVVRRRSTLRGRGAVARAEELLADVGLPADVFERRPSFLSGGQARRVGVARVLALDPAMIVADEPTAGLDVSVQAGLLNLLRAIVDDKGVGLLLITHNLATVRWIADDVVVMYLGHVVEAGPTAQVFARPAHPYTRALMEAVPHFGSPPVAGLVGDPPSILDAPAGCVFRGRCPQAVAACTTAPSMRSVAGRMVACHVVQDGP